MSQTQEWADNRMGSAVWRFLLGYELGIWFQSERFFRLTNTLLAEIRLTVTYLTDYHSDK